MHQPHKKFQEVNFQDTLKIDLGQIDHHTMIVEDAMNTVKFYCEVLGFEYISTLKLNTGTAKNGEFDMINHILVLPSQKDITYSITQGLTEDSFFCKYLKQNGPGLHHVAYRVKDLHLLLTKLHDAKIELTSKEPIKDPITGLSQIFISNKYTGFFIELIEWSDTINTTDFTTHNMQFLVDSLQSYA